MEEGRGRGRGDGQFASEFGHLLVVEWCQLVFFLRLDGKGGS
jgi:hypothetical protein